MQMGIDWMSKNEINEAIPPAYAEHIGRAALAQNARRGNQSLFVKRGLDGDDRTRPIEHRTKDVALIFRRDLEQRKAFRTSER